MGRASKMPEGQEDGRNGTGECHLDTTSPTHLSSVDKIIVSRNNQGGGKEKSGNHQLIPVVTAIYNPEQ